MAKLVDTTTPSTSYVRTNLRLCPGDSIHENSKLNDCARPTLRPTLPGQVRAFPPGRRVVNSPPSNRNTAPVDVPRKRIFVPAPLLDIISCKDQKIKGSRLVSINEKLQSFKHTAATSTITLQNICKFLLAGWGYLG